MRLASFTAEFTSPSLWVTNQEQHFVIRQLTINSSQAFQFCTSCTRTVRISPWFVYLCSSTTPLKSSSEASQSHISRNTSDAEVTDTGETFQCDNQKLHVIKNISFQSVKLSNWLPGFEINSRLFCTRFLLGLHLLLELQGVLQILLSPLILLRQNLLPPSTDLGLRTRPSPTCKHDETT